MNIKILSANIKNIFDKNNVPSLSVIITNKDKNIFEQYHGYNHLEKKIPFDENSIVRIASMTKPITSLCIFQLIEKNLISLETKLEDIDKRFSKIKIVQLVDNNIKYKKANNKIKIKHLLNHTSGYGYQFLNPEIKYLVDQKLLQDIQDDGQDFLDAPILFEPGTKWNYGISTDLLGYIIEKLTNKKLNDYMKENLFDKLDMHNTTFKLNENNFKNLAYIYNYIGNGLMINKDIAKYQDDRVSRSFDSGGGGLVSTTQDYAKFMRLFLNNNNLIISQKSINLMKTNQIGKLEVESISSVDHGLAASLDHDDSVEKKFGYGFMINNNNTLQGRPKGSISWSGIFNSFFWIDFKHNIGCAIFMQMLPYLNEISLKTYYEIETCIYKNINK
tara:strand:+ start:471 stop:1634 length:1164 start_codon:yes stop_codon:yes gene_type:complete